MNPKISVIMPTYNTAAYVSQAIASVLAQTESHLEVIIVDDASTDNTVEMIRQVADNRVRLLVNPENRGPSHSRNRALAIARGEWIALLDSDDWYAPERLEKLLDVASRDNLDLVADDQYMVKDGESRPWSSKWRLHGMDQEPARSIDACSFVARDVGMKPLFRKAFLERCGITFNVNLRYGEDYLFTLTCLVRGARAMVIPEGYYYYRSRGDSAINEQIGLHLQTRETTLGLLHNELVTGNAALVQQLKLRLERINRGLRYYRVIEPLKKGRFFTAARRFLADPLVVLFLLAGLPHILRHRIPRLGRGVAPQLSEPS